jgi:hypothetical protein
MNIKDKTGVVWALAVGVPVLLLIVGQFTPNKDFLLYVRYSVPFLISFAVGLELFVLKDAAIAHWKKMTDISRFMWALYYGLLLFVYIAFMTQFY